MSVIRKWKIGVAEGVVSFLSSICDLLCSVPLSSDSQPREARPALGGRMHGVDIQAYDKAKERAMHRIPSVYLTSLY